MDRYDIGGVVLGSTLVLPEVTPTRHGPADVEFVLGDAVDALEAPEAFHRRWTLGDDDATTWAWFVREDAGWRIRFPALGDFLVSADGLRVRCHPLRSTPEVTIRHLLLDQVLPLALSQQKRFALHASGVVIDSQAIGFVGRSGSGKSTIAAMLAREGAALLCDDCLLAYPHGGDWIAMPWYPGLRMWPDNPEAAASRERVPVAHYTSKVRVGEAFTFHESPAHLSALFILGEDGDAVSLRRLSPREALVALVESAYLLAQDDPAMLAAQLDFLGRLAEGVPCHILCYPYRHDVLPRVRELVLASLAAGTEPPCKTAMPA